MADLGSGFSAAIVLSGGLKILRMSLVLIVAIKGWPFF